MAMKMAGKSVIRPKGRDKMVGWRRLAAVTAFAVASCMALAPAMAANASADETWKGLAGALFPHQAMTEDGTIIKLGTPLSAEDAAVVPVTLHMNYTDPNLPVNDPSRVKKVTLIIDENPSPVAAVFELGPKASVSKIETRVRVNQNTKVHAVAETIGGKYYVSESFVAAAGGCSAPGGGMDTADGPPLGTIRVRAIKPEYVSNDSQRKEAVVMIKHPNNTGMQMDQETHLYIPARYVETLRISQDDGLIFAVTGGISISENPNFRFDYIADGSGKVDVSASDTKGAKFAKGGAVEPAM
jgi:sulfur-oxidizing protein SoxY